MSVNALCSDMLFVNLLHHCMPYARMLQKNMTCSNEIRDILDCNWQQKSLEHFNKKTPALYEFNLSKSIWPQHTRVKMTPPPPPAPPLSS